MEQLYARLASIALVALLLLPALQAAGHAAAAGRLVSLEARVGVDGLAVIHAVLPYEGCRVLRVSGASGAPVGGHPVALVFSPDPSLWRKAMGLSLLQTAEGRAASVKVERLPGGGVEVYAVLAGKPGSKVRVELECFGGSGAADNHGVMLIVVPDNPLVEEYARRIAAIHERHGLRVEVLTLSQLESVQPAPPPPDVCRPGVDGVPEYNLSLALRLVEYLREHLDSIRYVLLIGGARDVPPVYVCSPILRELVDREESIVPTDYYYADPNYDGYLELAVGRLPFTDPVSLSAYVKALERWVKGGDWQEHILVGGGAPFATTLLIGETAAERAYDSLVTLNASVNIIALTLGNYLGAGFAGYLGHYALYYLVAHGTGDAMLDYVPGGLWNYDFELKLSSSQIAAGNPAVFVTPACRVGFWDYDTMIPPFTPPSIGVKLVSSGAAVAFIGYSRIAIETIVKVVADSGRLTVRLGGADAPLLLFAKQLADAPTIGEAWRRALNAYLMSPDSHYIAFMVRGEEEIGHLVSREAVFLGDPAAPNPWRGRGGEWSPPSVEPPEESLWVGASLVAMPIAKYSEGYIPAFNPGLSTSIVFTVNSSCPEQVTAYALYRVEGFTFIGYKMLNVTTMSVGRSCTLNVTVPLDSPGLIRLTMLYPNGTITYYAIVGGAAYRNGTIVFRGLDALETIGDEVLAVVSDGRVLTVVPGGVTCYNLTAPSVEGVVAVRPLRHYDLIYGGGKVATEMGRLLELYRVSVPSPSPSKQPERPEAVFSPPMGVGGLQGGYNAAAAAGNYTGRAVEPMQILYAIAVLAAATLIAVAACRRGRVEA